MHDHYKLFLDKQTIFECNIELEGAAVKNAKARVVLENGDHSMLFEGTIDSYGKCKIPIKKLRGLYNEGDSGEIRLEVIAEDSYFQPWSSTYITETAKKMRVEVSGHAAPETPKLKVEVKSNSSQSKIVNEIVSSLRSKNVTKENINKKMKLVKNEIKSYLEESDHSFDTHTIITNVVNQL